MKIEPINFAKSVAFKIKKNLKSASIKAGILLVLFIFYSFIVNIFSYFDPFSLCNIGIDNKTISGNQETIKKAIGLVKKQDKTAYKTLCKYVNTIKESTCLASDPHLGSRPIGVDNPGCYIRGSKIIFLRPDNRDNANVVESRAETITKYANLSKNFWESRD